MSIPCVARRKAIVRSLGDYTVRFGKRCECIVVGSIGKATVTPVRSPTIPDNEVVLVIADEGNGMTAPGRFGMVGDKFAVTPNTIPSRVDI